MANTLGLPELALMGWMVAMLAILVVPASRICAKAGYSMWLGALAIVPIVNVLLAFFLAFVPWPIEKELARARGQGTAPAQ